MSRRLAEALAAVAGFGARAFEGHEALQHLLATEPGTVLPHLCFAGADNLLAVAADRIGPHLCRFMGPLEARRTGEWLARIVLSYGLAPPPEPSRPEVRDSCAEHRAGVRDPGRRGAGRANGRLTPWRNAQRPGADRPG